MNHVPFHRRGARAPVSTYALLFLRLRRPCIHTYNGIGVYQRYRAEYSSHSVIFMRPGDDMHWTPYRESIFPLILSSPFCILLGSSCRISGVLGLTFDCIIRNGRSFIVSLDFLINSLRQ